MNIVKKQEKIYTRKRSNMGILYDFKSNFPLVALGTQGPNNYSAAFGMTQQTADTLYKNTSLDGKVSILDYKWQKFIVPFTKNYTFEVAGADGGSAGTQNDKDFVKGGRGAIITATISLSKNDVLLILCGNHGWCQNKTDWGSCGGGASVVIRLNSRGKFTSASGKSNCDVLIVAGGGAGRADENRDSVNRISQDSCALNAIITDGINNNNGSNNAAYGGLGIVSILANTNFNITNSATQTLGGNNWTLGGGGPSYNGGGGGGGYKGGNANDNFPSYGGSSYANPEFCKKIDRKLREYKVEPSQNGYVKIYTQEKIK